MSTDRPRPLSADDLGDDAAELPIAPPVAGQAITFDAVIPSTAEQNVAADRARGRTAVQAGVATFVVVLAEYGFALAGVDLDPWGDGTGLPGTVNAALVGLLTYAMAYRMNPKSSDS